MDFGDSVNVAQVGAGDRKCWYTVFRDLHFWLYKVESVGALVPSVEMQVADALSEEVIVVGSQREKEVEELSWHLPFYLNCSVR